MPNERDIETEEFMINLSRLAECILPIIFISDPRITALMTGLSTPGLAYNYIQSRRNKKFNSNPERAACLISTNISQEYAAIVSGKKGQVLGFFSDKEVPVDFNEKAKRDDLVRVLKDPTYQHIALIGHGDGSCWEAKDGFVTREDLDYIMAKEGFEKKRGYFLQITCGLPDSTPLGKPVLEDPNKVLGYTNPTNIFDSSLNAFKPRIGLEPLLTKQF
jgi:hypothetical protein